MNTIAWAVRQDAPVQLQRQMEGLCWHSVDPVRALGPAPGKQTIEKGPISPSPHTDVFILGNHAIWSSGGDDCGAVEDLLFEVQRRLAIRPRQADSDRLRCAGRGTLPTVQHGIYRMTMKFACFPGHGPNLSRDSFPRSSLSLPSDSFALEYLDAVSLGFLAPDPENQSDSRYCSPGPS